MVGYAPKQFPFKQFLFFFFSCFVLFLNQRYPLEYVKAEIAENETLRSVNETAAQAVLNRLLVSSAIY